MLFGGKGVSVGSTLASASPEEVKLIEDPLEQIKAPRKGRGRPKECMKRLIEDKTYGINPLRKRVKAKKIELI